MKVRFAVAPHPGPPSARALGAFVDALEASAFDGIWLSDLPAAPVLDPLLGLAFAAVRTRRLRLGANIVPLGHNPFLLARSLAQLDQLSGGRLLLSFVTGIGQARERSALGLGDAQRGATLEQVLARVRALWTADRHGPDNQGPDNHGPDGVTRPIQDPLEVWLGGRGPRALDRVGRVADGWLGAQLTPREAETARRDIQTAAERAAREVDPEHFGLSIPYARTAPAPELLAATAARRADIDPLELVPVGASGLRTFVGDCISAGLSKFVVRPVAPVADWTDEAEWLAGAIGDLQT